VAKVSKYSFAHFHTSLVQDHTIKYAKKTFFKVFVLYNRNGSFKCFLMKKTLGGLLGVKLKSIFNQELCEN